MGKEIYYPSLRDIRKARKIFLENEPRDLFYRAATELVDLSIKGKGSLTLSEALAVLLQTWNRAYYQFRPFDASHFNRIDKIIEEKQQGQTYTFDKLVSRPARGTAGKPSSPPFRHKDGGQE